MIIKRILFFMTQYLQQLKKKWISLLLLFVFPIMILTLFIITAISFIAPTANDKISIGLVDRDGSNESQMITQFITLLMEENEHVSLEAMSITDAEKGITGDVLSAYIVFPENFTADLFDGSSVEVGVVGNPNRKADSFIIRELVDTLSRYIESAQANILTVYHYAKKVGIEEEEMEELKLEQFMGFTLYTLGKSNMLREEQIAHIATSTPKNYFTLAAWFIVTTIWSVGVYLLLAQQVSPSMAIRLKLLGVTLWHRMIARILTSFLLGSVLSTLACIGVIKILELPLLLKDYTRIMGVIIIYTFIVLTVTAVMDVLIQSKKVSLLVQAVVLGAGIVLSGAIIPSMYLPLFMQEWLPYVYFYEAWEWLVDLTLEERNYISYSKLLTQLGTAVIVLLGCLSLKERWSR
ncbi:ABC transporter permease [Lysinibacillus sp. 54212]|uniref:ABC transporter permease n=1 Tax=Lysinibacillus sp. 54212 TaxID=3119829 RepID=UPI002FC7661E